MCVEIVQYHDNLRGNWIKLIGQIFHDSCPFDPSALLSHLQEAFALERLEQYEQVSHTLAYVFVVLPGRFASLASNGFLGVSQQLFGHLIHANHGSLGIIGKLVDFQNVFHLADKSRIGVWWNTPLFFQPRFEFVFFKTLRIVS